MNEWHEVRFGAIATFKKGINYKSEDYRSEDSGHPFITIKCFVKGGGYEQTGLKFFGGHFTTADQLFEGDILFSVTDLTRAGDIVGSPLRVPFFGDDAVAVASMDCMKIEPDASLCNKEFLYHRMMLPDVRRQMVAYSAGSTVLHLDTKKVPRILVCIPKDIRVQQKIAHILQTIDRAIEHTAALIEKYRQIKAGLMHDLFTRGIAADSKLRPPREQAPHLYKETPIGWIPKEWGVVTLGQILTRIDAGWSPDCQEVPPGTGEWGVLKVSAVTKGVYDPAESKVLPPNLIPDPSIEVFNGDVILTRANGVAELVGVTVQVKNTPSKLMLSDKLLRLVPRHEAMEKDFLALAMKSDLIKSQIERVMSGSSGQRNISQAQLRKFTCICPDIEEQHRIAEYFLSAELKLERENLIRKKLILQKSGLMHDLLTAKVPVTVEDDAPEHAQTTKAAANE